MGSLLWACTTVNHALFHNKPNPLSLDRRYQGWARRCIYSAYKTEIFVGTQIRKINSDKNNAEMSLIIWLKGSLTHWILWNLTDFSNSESQAKLMFSCYVDNEDRLLIPTRKVFDFIHSLFSRENKIFFFFYQEHIPSQPRVLQFHKCALVISPAFFLSESFTSERVCGDPQHRLWMLVREADLMDGLWVMYLAYFSKNFYLLSST